MNRRMLKERVVLIVNSASAELAAADAAFAAGDTLTFSGTLEEVLVFALKWFAVNPLTISEEYSIVSERVFLKSALQPVTLTDLSQGTTVFVSAAELQLVADVTGQYREDFSQTVYAVFELVADATAKTLWTGSRAILLAYLLQLANGTTGEANRIYRLNKYSLFTPEVMSGAQFVDILSPTTGAIEVTKSLEILAGRIASVTL